MKTIIIPIYYTTIKRKKVIDEELIRDEFEDQLHEKLIKLEKNQQKYTKTKKI